MDLSQSRILISNDDGLGAKGLDLLVSIAESLCSDVWTIVPKNDQSGASHSLTLHRPLRVDKIGEKTFAIDGTPTDCVLLGVREILTDKAPDLVLSGINSGGNLGEEITYSGTVAAAMEGTLLGIKSISISQYMSSEREFLSDLIKLYLPSIIAKLFRSKWPKDVFMNVNFPSHIGDDIDKMVITEQGSRKNIGDIIKRKDPKGRIYYWIGGSASDLPLKLGSDFAAVSRGLISITPLYMDLTYRSIKDKLDELFKDNKVMAGGSG